MNNQPRFENFTLPNEGADYLLNDNEKLEAARSFTQLANTVFNRCQKDKIYQNFGANSAIEEQISVALARGQIGFILNRYYLLDDGSRIDTLSVYDAVNNSIHRYAERGDGVVRRYDITDKVTMQMMAEGELNLNRDDFMFEQQMGLNNQAVSAEEVDQLSRVISSAISE